MTGVVAFVLKGYPRLSETFIAQEIRELEARGMAIRIVSLRRPTDRATHPVHDEIRAPVHYLPEYLYRAPRRVFAAWRAVRRRPGYAECVRIWWRDLRRDPTPNRVRRLGQALVLAHELDPDVTHLHAHFLHTPASVARYAAVLRDLPWSCSAHARDIWTTPDWEKREKLAACRWAVTCTQFNQRHLRSLAPEPARVGLVYHGLDPRRFPPRNGRRAPRDGTDPADPVRILSVGRAVEKKGYHHLLGALARLPDDVHWRFEHVGGGAWLPRLKRRARALGIGARVHWCGALAHDAVVAHYAAADVFVLPSCIARDGDRDGIPNVLMEAQSVGLACLSTRVSAIPELIDDARSGLLVEQVDVAALADALLRLIREPELRERLGRAGRRRVVEHFSFAEGVSHLERRLAADV